MAKLRIRYFIEKTNADGSQRFYWQPSKELRAHGWQNITLKDEQGNWLPRHEAIKRAETMNQAVDLWTKENRQPEIPAPVTPKPVRHTLDDLIHHYKSHSPRWKVLKASTKVSYQTNMNLLSKWAGDNKVQHINPVRVQKLYLELSKKPAWASQNIRMLSILFKHARLIGWMQTNPAADQNMMPVAPRLSTWKQAQMLVAIARADKRGEPSLGDGIALAYAFGQRRGDTLKLTDFHMQKGVLKLKQGKTDALVEIPVPVWVTDRLAEARLRRDKILKDRGANIAPLNAPLVLSEVTGRGYDPRNFTKRFAKLRDAVAKKDPAFADLKFKDLRDTCVTRLADAGCTEIEIAAITGHTLQSVHTILKSYLSLTSVQASNAMRKLAEHETLDNLNPVHEEAEENAI